MRMSLVCMHVCACARAMCNYVYVWIHELIYSRRERPAPSIHPLATIHLLITNSRSMISSTQISPKVPWTSARPRAKVDSRWGRMSGGSITTTFSNTSSQAWLVSPLTFKLSYKSLRDWSTQNVHSVLPALSTGCPACHFLHCSASNNWFYEPCRTELKVWAQICTDESFGILKWEDQIPSRIFGTALIYT